MNAQNFWHFLFMRLVGLSICIALPLHAMAADAYPNKPIRLIVGYPPGGSTDLLARVVGQQLSVNLGQQVIVDNRAGGGGNIANLLTARATPDGYTLIMAISGIVTTAILSPNVGYDPLKDFAPVALVATSPYNVVVHPSVQAATIHEFVKVLKATPGKLNYGMSGTGGGMHLAVEYFKILTQTDALAVAYRGTGPAITDLVAGRINFMFAGALSSLPHIQAKRVRALATTGAKRSSAFPELPTLRESVVPNYEAGEWFGVIAPAKVPKAIVAKLHKEISIIINAPDFQARLVRDGAIVGQGSPEAFGAYIQVEHKKWSRVVTEAKISSE